MIPKTSAGLTLNEHFGPHRRPVQPSAANFGIPFKQQLDALVQPSAGQWLPMHTAPRDASWIEVLTVNGEIHRAHFASGGGEEQPPFEGWFKESESSTCFYEITEALVEWRPILAPPAPATAQAEPGDDRLIKPCPFCGHPLQTTEHKRNGCYVVCRACVAHGPVKHSKQEAVTAWNSVENVEPNDAALLDWLDCNHWDRLNDPPTVYGITFSSNCPTLRDAIKAAMGRGK